MLVRLANQCCSLSSVRLPRPYGSVSYARCGHSPCRWISPVKKLTCRLNKCIAFFSICRILPYLQTNTYCTLYIYILHRTLTLLLSNMLSRLGTRATWQCFLCTCANPLCLSRLSFLPPAASPCRSRQH